MKACIDCGDMKPLGDFYKHDRMADGHLSKCKKCCRRYARERHRQKMQDPEWRAAERERSRAKWREHGYESPQDPQQRAAQVAVGNAVRDGRLVPADMCEDCGHDFSEFRREGHHEDYSRPLDVAWLCSLCHGKRHRQAA